MSGAADSNGMGLLAIVEPGEEGELGAALLAEARRLAVALGCEARAFTWEGPAGEDPAAQLDRVAMTLAAEVRTARTLAVLFADSDVSRELAPLLAHRLGCGAVLGCSDVVAGRSGGLAFVKPVYGGWLEQEVCAGAGTTAVVTLDLSGAEAPAAADGQAPVVETLVIAADAAGAAGAAAQVRRLELLPPDAKSVDLIHAKRIVSAGMGVGGEELLAAVQELAGLLDGSVGATRPVVDEGRLPKERLIGQPGRTVTPDLYVALGISGSPHHVAGVRKADKIVAGNRDPRAPIFQFSDVGYVADLQAVLPALVARIKEWRDAGE